MLFELSHRLHLYYLYEQTIVNDYIWWTSCISIANLNIEAANLNT